MNLQKIQLENLKLKEENIELRRQISIAKLWMEKEVKNQVTKIAKKKVSKMACKTKDSFFSENVEEMITNRITDFFGEILLLNTPTSVVDNIISAEVGYYNLRENPHSDGLGVISSYHKSLDTLVESFITKGFRKFAKKVGQTQLRKNDPLEKALNSVVNKGYILSIGRLFHLIELIKKDENMFDFGKCFKNYLEKYAYISDILLDDNVYKYFETLVESEILGKKRHVGKINFVETRSARKLLIGDFKDNNCLIYKFIEIGKVEY